MVAWLLLAIGVLLTIGTALFVAAEFSLVSLDRPTVERAVAAGDTRAEGVLTAVRSLSTQLSGAQVGITLTTLVVGYLVEPSLATLLSGPLTSAGLAPDAVEPVAVGLGLLVATVFSMIFGELLPQNLGISVPLATAKVVAGPQRAFTRAVLPLITLLNGSANAFLRRFGVEPQEELSSGRTPEELAALVRRSAQAGTLDIQGSLDFLQQVRQAVSLPLLRKDFIVDRYQLLQARAAGADCVLLIAECLPADQLKRLHQQAAELGMQTLIELFEPDNLEAVLQTGTQLVGVNNRDLRTFETSLEHTLNLRPSIPPDRLVVGESGIRNHADLVRLGDGGVKAVLVGESLMRQNDITDATRRLLGHATTS